MKCLMCNSVKLESKTEIEKISYKNTKLFVAMDFTECQDCGYDFVPVEQIKLNDLAVVAAKRTYDGLLTPEQVLKIRLALGFTQSQAAEVFGGGRNAFSKYERGEVAQSEAMDKLLRICAAYPNLVSEVDSKSYQQVKSNVVYIEDWKETDLTNTHNHVFNTSGIITKNLGQDIRYEN